MKTMIRKTKKVLAYMLVTALMLTGLITTNSMEVQAASSVTITESAGWLESAYVEWSPVSGAKGYAVYVKGASQSDSSYVQLDSELIRQYSSYWRADALGLTAGNYVLKVVAVMSDGSTVGAQTASLTVKAHDRSGFAWVDGTASGAYNEDGSLKTGAKVVYVTNDTADSLVSELEAYADGSYPLCVRIIGEVEDFSGMDKGDLLIDNGGNDVGLTIEGVGEDATANGWGIRIKNSTNIEIRNIGVMNCDSSEGDNIGLQQKNTHIWVHNCDLFYGDAGSDADQVKGDGALDTKKSQYVTHSYNHFWDSGKCNLQGANSSDTSNYITYHHNWYDHSDSRHPRVRVATVHVYNNYYDGNAKYGIGSTTDSDIFAEANYFRNCKNPMMISGQGTDALGEGTFSGEVGGMIKAYNNYIEGAESFISYQENSTEFDAYVATSRNETLSSSVKNVDGKTYNNFDTSSSMYDYDVQSPAEAKASVEKYAGRVNGGDFQWDFNDAVEDTNYDVVTELKSALVAYSTSLVSVGGYEGSVDVPDTEAPTLTEAPSVTEAPTTAPTATPTAAATTAPTQAPSGEVEAADYVHNFTTDGKSSSFFSITGNLSTSKGSVSYNGLSLTQCLKMESSTSVTFTTDAAAELTLVFNSANSSNVKVDGTKYTLTDGILTMDIAAGSHTITKADTANLFYMAVNVEGTSSGSTATAAPAATATPTVAPTATPTTAPTEAPTQAPSASGVAYTGSTTITGANWWASKDIAKSDLLGSVDASDVTFIKFSANTDFWVCYNATSGYTQASGQNLYELSNVNLSDSYYLQLCISKSDNVDYTITWEVYTDSLSASTPTAAPTATPTVAPTATPTVAPTAAPTATPTTAPTQAPSTDVETASYVHNFTTDGTSSSFFGITGNLSTSKGSVSYNGLSLTQCLKMESSTSITFTTSSAGELVLVFNSANSSNVKVDGTKYTLTNGILTMDIAAGSHTITKADTANLFYMAVNAAGSSSGSDTSATPTPAPTATAAPSATATPTAAPTVTAAPSVVSGDIFVSPNGKSSNAGTQSNPMDLATAIESIAAGKTIWMMSGTYSYSSTILIEESNCGKSGAYKTVSAYNGADVVIDFSAMSEAGSNRGIVLDGDYWYFYGIDIKGAGDNGMLLSGSNNIIEMCQFYENHDTGLQLSRYNTSYDELSEWPSYNQIINCTSYNNKDEATAENADGFAAKLTCGEGNVFDGCIAYCNSDDGWDLYAKPATGAIGVVTIKNCVAFGNGKLTDGSGSANGDMNGFKLGGSNGQCPTPHVVMNSLAFNNGACGFTDNGNGGALSMSNCTAVNNGVYASKANYMCYRTSSSATYKNLLSFSDTVKSADKFLGKMSNTVYANSGFYYISSGSFSGSSVKEGTKLSLSSSIFESATIPGYSNGTYATNYHEVFRNADGSVNMNGLFQVKGSGAVGSYGVGASLD